MTTTEPKEHKKVVCPMCSRGNHRNCSDPTHCGCKLCYPDVMIEWGELPSHSGRGTTGYAVPDEVLDELRKYPKRWARIKTFNNKQTASYQANKLKKNSKYPDIEFAGRRHEDSDESDLWARCITDATE